MVTVKEVVRLMDEIAPFHIQMEFDNAGFLVGRGEKSVERILVALDVTQEVVKEAAERGCQLIIAHHPVIFHPVRSVTDETPAGRVLLALAESGIAAICAHTNLDAVHGGVNDCLAQTLGLTGTELLEQDGVDSRGQPYGIGRAGAAHTAGMSAEEYADFVKGRLNAASVRFTDGGKPVNRVAVGGGSCGSMLREAVAAGCDTFVTADVKYDQYLEAKALGMTLIDAGHFATENVVCGPLAAALAQRLPDTEVLLSERHREVYQGM